MPTFTNQSRDAGYPLGGAIFGIAIVGAIILMLSFFGRR
jgi:hypothetical protein